MPHTLYLKSNHSRLGDISDAEFQFLQDNLEEESISDTDYALTRMTLDYLRGSGMPANLDTILTTALGEAEEVEIEFETQDS